MKLVVTSKGNVCPILSMHALTVQACSAVCVKGLTINKPAFIISIPFSLGKGFSAEENNQLSMMEQVKKPWNTIPHCDWRAII
jgi:hypothetical protein